MNEGLRTNLVSNIVRNSDNYSNEDLLIAIDSLMQIYKEKQKQQYAIPLSLFSNKKLGILEVAVKFLRENHSLNYHEIAFMINRDDRTIWVTYNDAIKKQKGKLNQKESKHHIPITIFSDRKLGPLEALTVFLKDQQHLSFNEISVILNRDYRTVWLSYRHGIKKRGSDGRN